MIRLGRSIIQSRDAKDSSYPILICLLGNFVVLKTGRPVSVRRGGKTESLLCSLALCQGYCVPRDALLNSLWPNTDLALAGQCLNTLVHSLHKQLGDGIGGAAPVVCSDGTYYLNVEAGVAVDIKAFDNLANAGQHEADAGHGSAAAGLFTRAVRLYRGDLSAGSDVHAIIERERLRARYLNLLAHLADHFFDERDYATCLENALRLLTCDPLREDAHRVVMRCYVRRGQRAQALRQYRICEEILRSEFNATPEVDTTELFDLIRLDPGRV